MKAAVLTSYEKIQIKAGDRVAADPISGAVNARLAGWNNFMPVREAVQRIRGGGTVCVPELADDTLPLLMIEWIARPCGLKKSENVSQSTERRRP